jgi:MFS transporter, DHA2 family, multidrug resistance protein
MATAAAIPFMSPQSTVEHGFRRTVITITVILAAVIELIDTTIVNVALNQISGNLGATIEDVAWVVISYSIANIIVIPLASFLGDLIGRRRYYIGSIILFTVASVLCGISTNIWELVFFRFVQGLGGGALISTSQTILFESYAPEERGMASGLFGLGLILGPTIGPSLGGYLVDTLSWHWCFFVNIPIGIFAAGCSYFFVKEPLQRRIIKNIDWTGIVLLALAVGSLQFVLERGESKDWFQDSTIVLFSVIAAFSLVGFIWQELRVPEPAVNLRVLTKSPTLVIGTMLTFVLGFGLFGSLFIYPVFVQRLIGFSAMQTGLSLLPGAILTAFLMPNVGRLLQRGFSSKVLLIVGFVGFAGFTWMMSFVTLQSGGDDFYWPLMLRGVGMGFLMIPITAFSLYGLTGKDVGQASGLSNMNRQLGGTFGIALINTFVAQRTAVHRNDILSSITTFNTQAMERLSALTNGFMGKSPAEAQAMAYGAIERTVSVQSLHLAYMDAFKLTAIIFVACAVILLVVRMPKAAASAAVAPADTSNAH